MEGRRKEEQVQDSDTIKSRLWERLFLLKKDRVTTTLHHLVCTFEWDNNSLAMLEILDVRIR
jgi:hypothetical protein